MVSSTVRPHSGKRLRNLTARVLWMLLQSFKIVPAELKVGTITDAIVCRMAASHC